MHARDTPGCIFSPYLSPQLQTLSPRCLVGISNVTCLLSLGNTGTSGRHLGVSLGSSLLPSTQSGLYGFTSHLDLDSLVSSPSLVRLQGFILSCPDDHMAS